MNAGYFVIAGFQKCASTWLHRSLQAHHELYLPDTHMLHFFDIHYDRGISWYEQLYASAAPHQVVGDATVTYARSHLAMSRIAEYDERARVILILRNPIDRAWSHYWHERKKGKMAFAFEEWEQNYDLYSDWILPGMYDQHIEVAESFFLRARLLVIFQDDIEHEPTRVLSSVFGFLGVESVNKSLDGKGRVNATVVGGVSKNQLWFGRFGKARREREAYLAGPSERSVRRLREIYKPVVRELESRYNRDLERWLYPST